MASGGQSDISDEIVQDTQIQTTLKPLFSGSRKSRHSSVSSTLSKTAARRAALTAELTFLKKQQELDEMEMKLRQMKEKLRIEKEMAILVLAEEKLSIRKLAKSGNRRQTEGATGNIRPTSKDVIASPSHRHPLLEGATDNTRPSSKGDTQMPLLHRQQLDGATTDIYSPSRHMVTSSSLPCPPPEGATSHFHPLVESVIAPRQHPRPPLGGTTADPAPIPLPVGDATASVPLQPHQADADVTPDHPDGATVPAGGASASRSPTAVHTHTVLNPHAPELTAHHIAPDTSTHLVDYGNPPQVHGKDDQLAHILQQGQWQQRQLINAIQIPEVELMTYDGDPLKYWGFICMFDNSVERDTVDSSAKLSRLLQYTSGRARAVIQGCAVMNPDIVKYVFYYCAKVLLFLLVYSIEMTCIADIGGARCRTWPMSSRWMKEYLPALQGRQKWLAQKQNLTIGDIVLLVNEDTPQSVWPIAPIVDTFPGKDGLVWSEEVKTKNSVLVHPVNKLCLLVEVH